MHAGAGFYREHDEVVGAPVVVDAVDPSEGRTQGRNSKVEGRLPPCVLDLRWSPCHALYSAVPQPDDEVAPLCIREGDGGVSKIPSRNSGALSIEPLVFRKREQRLSHLGWRKGEHLADVCGRHERTVTFLE